MSDKKYTLWEAMAVFAVAVPVVLLTVGVVTVISLPFSILVAWVRVQLWNWFAVPYLHLPPIPIWAMFGLSVFISTFVPTKSKLKDAPQPDWKDEGKALMFNVFGWLIALGLGYAIHTWLLR
jgi:hypothetical protein